MVWSRQLNESVETEQGTFRRQRTVWVALLLHQAKILGVLAHEIRKAAGTSLAVVGARDDVLGADDVLARQIGKDAQAGLVRCRGAKGIAGATL